MDFNAAFEQRDEPVADPADLRAAPRYTSLIRAAKLVSAQGEFVCVIRDVSATGISVRMFHDLPGCDAIALELQNGESYELNKIRAHGSEASFTFDQTIEVERLIHENWRFPKRQLRLNIAIPLIATTLAGRFEVITENLSQQGARFECEPLLAIDQPMRLEGSGLPEIRAKVRWRRDHHYGVVFDNTFSLRDFARVAARMQCPALVTDGAG